MFGLAACGRIGIDATVDGDDDPDGGGDVRNGLRYAFDLDAIQNQLLKGETGTNVDGYVWNTDSVIAIPAVRNNGLHFDGTESVGFALFPAVDTNCMVPAASPAASVATWARFDVSRLEHVLLSDIAVMYGSNGGIGGGWGLGATDGCGVLTAGFTLAEPMQSPGSCAVGHLSSPIGGTSSPACRRVGADRGVYVDGVLDNGAQCPVPCAAPLPVRTRACSSRRASIRRRT
jgi:hypothetical protein